MVTNGMQWHTINTPPSAYYSAVGCGLWRVWREWG